MYAFISFLLFYDYSLIQIVKCICFQVITDKLASGPVSGYNKKKLHNVPENPVEFLRLKVKSM